MLVSEVKRQREVLENQIKVLVTDFEKRSEMQVTEINLTHIRFGFKQPELVELYIELETPRY